MLDPGPRAAKMNQVTPWAIAGSSPPESSWGTPLPQGGTLEARRSRGILEVLGLGGARKALNWTEPAEKASWAGPAETKESWAGPAGERTLRAPGTEQALERTLQAPGTERALERTLQAPGMERTWGCQLLAPTPVVGPTH